MKKYIYLAFLLLIISTYSSCKKDTSDEIKKFALHIDLQGGFNQDSVMVYLNNSVFIQDTFTTNNVLSLAGSRSFNLENGDYLMQVRINNSTTYTENIQHNGVEYLGINYNKTNNTVQVIHSDKPFMYE